MSKIFIFILTLLSIFYPDFKDGTNILFSPPEVILEASAPDFNGCDLAISVNGSGEYAILLEQVTCGGISLYINERYSKWSVRGVYPINEVIRFRASEQRYAVITVSHLGGIFYSEPQVFSKDSLSFTSSNRKIAKPSIEFFAGDEEMPEICRMYIHGDYNVEYIIEQKCDGLWTEVEIFCSDPGSNIVRVLFAGDNPDLYGNFRLIGRRDVGDHYDYSEPTYFDFSAEFIRSLEPEPQ